jgi:hypothetical protein
MLEIEDLSGVRDLCENHLDRRELLCFLPFGVGKFWSNLNLLYSATPKYKCDPNYSGPKKRPKEFNEKYRYKKRNIEGKVELVGVYENFCIKRVEFNSIQKFLDESKVTFDFYEQKSSGKFPTILMCPILSGIDPSVTSFANYFSNNGFNCAIVHNQNLDRESEDPEYMEKILRQVIVDNRQILDYLEVQDRVEKNKFGIFGVSMGALKAVVSAGVDDRFVAGVYILGGGSMADIFCSSDEPTIRLHRKKLQKKYSIKEIHSGIMKNIESDPLQVAKYIDARQTLMYIGLFDKTVPRKCGDKLLKEIGNPEHVYTFGNHYTSMVYLPIALEDTFYFFKDRLRK